MNESTKSLIRHILTAIGAIAMTLGIDSFTGIIEYIQSNFDQVTASVTAVIGFLTTLFGFFKDKDRLEVRANAGQ